MHGVTPLKDKKGITITHAFQKILKESTRKPNKIWIDKGSKFYNKSMKSWLEKMSQKCIQHIMKESLLEFRTLKKQNIQLHDFNTEKCVY